MFNRLLTSRKLWGAVLGSITIVIVVHITPESVIGNVVTVVGGMWSAAIGGQAVNDAISSRRE
jgi:hypothetical protein